MSISKHFSNACTVFYQMGWLKKTFTVSLILFGFLMTIIPCLPFTRFTFYGQPVSFLDAWSTPLPIISVLSGLFLLYIGKRILL